MNKLYCIPSLSLISTKVLMEMKAEKPEVSEVSPLANPRRLVGNNSEGRVIMKGLMPTEVMKQNPNNPM